MGTKWKKSIGEARGRKNKNQWDLVMAGLGALNWGVSQAKHCQQLLRHPQNKRTQRLTLAYDGWAGIS